MLGGKPSKYCKISVFLEHNAPTLYQNINDLCLFGALNTRHGRGVTFIIPDKKNQTQINKLTNSKEPEKAVKMIKDLIIPNYLDGPGDFIKKYTLTSNGKTALDIKNVTSSGVVLNNGTKITNIPSYIKLHSESRQNIMQANGVVSVIDTPSDFEPKKGGYFTGGAKRKINNIEKHFYNQKCNIKSHIKFESKGSDPLTNYLCANKGDKLVQKTFNGSPLSALFLYPLVESKFFDNPPASDMRVLFEPGVDDYIREEKKARAASIRSANASNIVGLIKERYNVCWDKCGDIHNYFENDKDAFINWSMAKDEFCLLHTENYINAIRNNEEKEFQKIFHCFENYVCDGLVRKNYKNCLHLTNSNMESIGNVPLFCRRIEFILSSISFCGFSMGEILDNNSFVKELDNPSVLKFCKRDLSMYFEFLQENECY